MRKFILVATSLLALNACEGETGLDFSSDGMAQSFLDWAEGKTLNFKFTEAYSPNAERSYSAPSQNGVEKYYGGGLITYYNPFDDGCVAGVVRKENKNTLCYQYAGENFQTCYRIEQNDAGQYEQVSLEDDSLGSRQLATIVPDSELKCKK